MRVAEVALALGALVLNPLASIGPAAAANETSSASLSTRNGALFGDEPPLPATRYEAVSDGALTVEDLEDRPLVRLRVEPGQTCPQASATSEISGVGPAVEVGPVAGALLQPIFAEGPGLRYGKAEIRPNDKPRDGWHRAKMLWLVRAGTPEPVIVRGARIDRPGGAGVRWSNNGTDPTLSLVGDATSTAPPEWRDIPSAVLVRHAGCYAFQIDGLNFQSILILRARPEGDD